MKIASFNVENLFDRAKAFNELDTLSTSIISGCAELNNIFEKEIYCDTDINRIKKLFKVLGFEKSDKGGYAILRKIRGRIVSRPKNKPYKIVAKGRKDWIGWVELKTAPVNEIAILNTGRVIKDVNADVLTVIEAEDRPSLNKFSEYIIKKVGGVPYNEVMLIDGNDDRGIDVGVMAKNGYSIKSITSHIYDTLPDGKIIFSRDCPEYEIVTPLGNTIWILPNHFKSKYGGNDINSRNKRLAQSKQAATIYNDLLAKGHKNIIILGDLNDTPDSDELKPLIQDTDLQDVFQHNSFDTGEFDGIGTYGLGNDNNKIDYLLLSPDLFDKVTASGLFRKGAWAGKRPKRWETYPSIKKEIHVASDHHVIWAEINI